MRYIELLVECIEGQVENPNEAVKGLLNLVDSKNGMSDIAKQDGLLNVDAGSSETVKGLCNSMWNNRCSNEK